MVGGFTGAAAIRRAVARSPCAPRARRLCSSPPSEFTEAERRLYARIAEVEKFGNERANQLREKYSKLQAEHNKVMKFYSKSTSQARDAVRVTAGVSAVFVAGLVGVGLAAIHLSRPKAPSATESAAAAAAEPAKAAAAAAAAKSSDALAVLGERRPSLKKEQDVSKDASKDDA